MDNCFYYIMIRLATRSKQFCHFKYPFTNLRFNNYLSTKKEEANFNNYDDLKKEQSSKYHLNTKKNIYFVVPRVLVVLGISLGFYLLSNEKDEFYYLDIEQLKSRFTQHQALIQKQSNQFEEWFQSLPKKKREMEIEQIISDKFEFLNQKMKIKYVDGIYEGEGQKRGDTHIKHGKGTIFLDNKIKIEGTWANDLTEGVIIFYYPDGRLEICEHTNGQRNGLRILQHPNGNWEESELILKDKIERKIFHTNFENTYNVIRKNLIQTPQDISKLFPQAVFSEMAKQKDNYNLRFILLDKQNGKGLIYIKKPEFTKYCDVQMRFDAKSKKFLLHIHGKGIGIYPNGNVEVHQYVDNQVAKAFVWIKAQQTRWRLIQQGQNMRSQRIY